MKGLMEKRAALVEELDKLHAVTDTEQRAYTEEEAARSEELTQALADIDATIAKQSEQRAAIMAGKGTQTEATVETRSYSQDLNDLARGRLSAAELRANESTMGNSSSAKWVDFSTDIIKKATDLAQIINEVNSVAARGTYKQIVQSDSYKVSGGWVAEAAEFGVSESRWSTITIDKYKYGSVSVLTLELLNEAAFDVTPEITSQFALDFAVGMENGIIAGTGDSYGQPTGLLSGGTAQTLASASAITADDVVRAFHSLKSPYYANAKWIMNNDTLAKLRLLKDATGNYLFHQNELTTGYVGTIFGKPVLISEYMPSIESGAKPILFGDFRQGYKAVRTPEITLSLLTEKYAHIGAIGIQGIMWLGGKPVNDEAYTVVTMA